ncbi:UDP-glycosyltransferase 88B1-like [Euphorbia lathyris]|uniref:UDP-glycosyltransferase 88B1-like n=1 Tax=Euphorbia lathyris TaxID=212925 RepID=UPI0033135F1A
MAQDTIVLYPSPGKGHIFSMIELANTITKHHPSISVTIIILTSPDDTTNYSSPTPSIKFVHLPAVPLPAAVFSSFKDVVASFFEFPELNNDNLHQALTELSNSTNIKALVIDFFCNSAVDVSSSLNIPIYYYYTCNATALCCLLYWPTIDKNVAEGFKVVDIPGAPRRLSSEDLPLVMLERSHRVYDYFIDTANQMAKSAGIILNSFQSLEPRAVKALVEGNCTPDSPIPPIYFVGPVVSIRKEEHECLSWLDSQPSRSVVFLCFGSMGVLPPSQLKEIAIALEKSEVTFLWIVRKPQTNDESTLESFLPEGFLERTENRGSVVNSWAPQAAVLNHDSVGVFVSHCGWNSILESVLAGVPMLAWPLYAEQKMNAKLLVEEMKLALSVTRSENGSVSASELELRLNEIMNTEIGKVIRKNVGEMRAAAVNAVSDGGSSLVDLSQLVDSFTV